MTKQYPDLDPSLRIVTGQGRLYTEWSPDMGRTFETAHLGVMYAGIPYDGQFRWSVIDDFLTDQHLPDLTSVSRLDLEVWLHVAFTDLGLFSSKTLYGISMSKDSKIYRAELNTKELYPTIHW